MSHLFKLVLIVCLVTAGAAAGESPRTLTWDDLVPPDAEYPDDPLERLNFMQREDVIFILTARNARALPEFGDDGAIAMEVAEREQRLRRAGLDIDRLIAEVIEVDAAWQAADEKVDPTLDGKLIRMPGYVLPLEFSGSLIKEFLLVPFVGACIHVPPPPANQIVYVRVKGEFRDSGLFTPVYVTGRMSATAGGNVSLFLVDGSANVNYGYEVEATSIEKYQE